MDVRQMLHVLLKMFIFFTMCAPTVEELVQEIKQHQDLKVLRLEGNTLGVDAARAIAKALESKDQLQVHIIKAKNCCLTVCMTLVYTDSMIHRL